MGRSCGKPFKRKKSLETKIKCSSPGESSRAAFLYAGFFRFRLLTHLRVLKKNVYELSEPVERVKV